MLDIDEKIIRLLKENGRMSYTEMGKKLNVSGGTVRNRIEKLMEKGIIEKFTIKVGGKSLKVLIDLILKANVDATKIAQKIIKLEGVESVFEVSGDTDLVVLVGTGSSEELSDLLDSIRTIGNAVTTHTHLILKEI
jgi:DNA-binding Lrp family transcriptional regulator